MDVQTVDEMPQLVVPPVDRQARDRSEQVAAALLDLCGRLETRIDALAQRMDALDAALEDLIGDGRRG